MSYFFEDKLLFVCTPLDTEITGEKDNLSNEKGKETKQMCTFHVTEKRRLSKLRL